MRKTTFLKSCLLLLAMLLGVNSAWAGYVTSYTFATAKNGSNSAYANNYDVTIDGLKWSVPGNQNNDGFVRIGGKSLDKVDRVITGKSAIADDINKITMKHKGVSSDNLKVNSITITVASDAAFANVIEEISKTPTLLKSTDGSIDFEPGESEKTITSWGANRYYKFTINVTNSKSSNYGFDLASIVFYKEGADKEAAGIAFSAENAEVTIDANDNVFPSLTNPHNLIVAYTSSNTSVATINDEGAITLLTPGTTTITAKYDGDETYGEAEASYSLKVYKKYATIADMQKENATSYVPAILTFTNVIVTMVNGDNVYIIDENGNGAQIYQGSHGLEAGQIISGTIKATIKKNNGNAQISNFNKEGLTISEGTLSPTIKTIDQLSAANHGMLVTLKGVNYLSSTTSFTDGTNSIKYYDTFKPTGDDALAPEDGKAYDATGIFINYNGTLEISPRTKADLAEVVSTKEMPISLWKQGDEEIKSICITNGGTITATFITNSTGEKTFESSNENVATVNSSGEITLKKDAKGMAIITAKTEGNNDFISSITTLTILVGEPIVDGIFSFANYQDYGSGMIPASSDNTTESTWTAGNVTMKVAGRNVWYNGTNGLSLRFYKDNATDGSSNAGNLTFSVPSGYVIYKITGLNNILTPSDGSTANTIWQGNPVQTISFTHNGGGTATLTEVKVYYTEPTVSVTTTGEYTSFCSDVQLDFTGTGVTVYKAKVDGSVVKLTEIEEGKVPAGAGVILKAAANNYTATVIAPIEKLTDNELIGVTSDTEVKYSDNSKFNYILQSGKFYKATGAKLKAGKAYLKTAYDVTAATGGARLQIVIDGETNAIANVRGQMEDVKGIFNLQGQRVEKAQKGLYIMNGKKVLVK